MTKAAIVQRHLAELLDEELSSIGFQRTTKWAVRRETQFVDQDIEFQPLSAWDAFVINLRTTFKWPQLLQDLGADKFNRNTVASIRISRFIDPMQDLRIPATERSYKKVHRDVLSMIRDHALPYFDRFRPPEEFVKAVESGEFSRTELFGASHAALLSLAMCYRHVGDEAKARKCLTEYLATEPDTEELVLLGKGLLAG